MRGAVDVGDAVLRLDRRCDGEVFQRGGRLAVGLQRVDVLDDAVLVGGDALEAQGDLLIAVGRDREDLELGQVVAEVLEQAGVLGAADDVGVDLAGLGGLDDLALDFLAVHPHGEVVEAGALGQGEDVGGFEGPVGVVAEGLFDVGDGDLVLDGDGHLVVEHRQRRDGLVLGDEQPAGVGGTQPRPAAGRRPAESGAWFDPFL